MSRKNRCVTYPQPRDPVSVHRLTRNPTMNRINDATKLNTRLMESIAGGDIADMKRLMKLGANPNATCRLNHVSACHIAAMHDNDALDLLLRSRADSSRSDKQGRTPLHFAAWAGNAKQIALLLDPPEVARYVPLEREACGHWERRSVEDRIEISRNVEHTIVTHSVPENNFEIIPSRPNEETTLSDCLCDVLEYNCGNVGEQLPPFQQGWTALHAASARAHLHCVQLLLAASADSSAQDKLCRTPLDVAGCAHYMGHKIDVNNLIKTVDLLLKAGGKFLKYCPERHSLVTPLHTAVELESEAAVELMLQGGASAKFWNSQGLTAMHVCVKKRNKELLQLLANHKYSNEDPYLCTVDVKDESGFTMLCAAVEAEWIQGVCIALGAGASIILKANEETPIHIAAKVGNIDILQKILNIAKNSTIDFRNEEGETALFEAINHNHLDVLKFLLKHGSSIEVENSKNANVFHVATKYGRKEILEYLLKYDSDITKRLINKSDCFVPPLHYALEYNRLDCARLLISNGAKVNMLYVLDYHNITRKSPLHIVVIKNHYEIAEMIIKHDSKTVHATDSAGRTPLHEACSRGNKKIIKLLLRNGAILSGGENVNKSYYFAKQRESLPIELLMNNVSKPTEFMQEIFDSYITSKGQESNCEVEVDYRVLFPKPDMQHMGIIKALINTGNRYQQQRLLLHPLVQSFLYPKWRSLLSFFYGTLALHVCFVLSLNVFALSLFWCNDAIPEPVWIYTIYITAFLLTIQEIIVINMKSKSYLLCLETLVKWLSTTFAIILPQVVSWDSKPNPEWVRLFGSVTLLLTWVRMMFLLSRLPDYGYYFLMYGKVATNVFKILISFGFLIFGFSISFMIQFHARTPFDDPWSSLLTTMVMMTSEFGYNEIMDDEIVKESPEALIMKRLIFVSFLILVSIILMTLLVGVAVNDVNSLEIIGNINRLEKQVQFITSFEDIGCNIFIKKILPTSLYKRCFENINWKNRIVLRPRKPARSNGYILPAYLNEAIFENAQLQKRQLDEEQGTRLYQIKLDEMHKIIVKSYRTEPTTTERLASLDTAMHNLFEEILKLRSEFKKLQSINKS